jgi:hypothetical protein
MNVAKAFGLLQDENLDKNEGQAESQAADFTDGEGRCPMLPLVFKNGDWVFDRSMTGV